MPESTLVASSNSHELVLSTASLIADIARLLVHYPDQVDLKIRNDGNTVILCLAVALDDLGRVIGTQGRTAHSLRVVLSSISSKTGIRFELDIHAEQT